MSEKIQPAILPPHLLPMSPRTMPIDTPAFVTPDHIYLDPVALKLYVDKNEFLQNGAERRGDDEAMSLYGKVALMRVAFGDAETQPPQIGFVADFRFVDAGEFCVAPPREQLNDDDLEEVYDGDDPIMAPLAAYAHIDPIAGEYDTQVAGDKRFGAAALYLAELVDKIYAGEDITVTEMTIPGASSEEDESDEQEVVMIRPNLFDRIGGAFQLIKEKIDDKAAERRVVREFTRGLKQQVREQVAEQIAQAKQ